MKKSRYEELANVSESVWNRYGLTESQWAQLTTEEREIHYGRSDACEHPYRYDGPDWSGDTGPYSLRTAYSFDPYFHSAHMDKCLRPAECFCQMCANKIGISRDMDKSRIDEEQVREKWRKKLAPREVSDE